MVYTKLTDIQDKEVWSRRHDWIIKLWLKEANVKVELTQGSGINAWRWYANTATKIEKKGEGQGEGEEEEEGGEV